MLVPLVFTHAVLTLLLDVLLTIAYSEMFGRGLFYLCRLSNINSYIGITLVILRCAIYVLIRFTGLVIPIVVVRYHAPIRARLSQQRPGNGIINIILMGKRTNVVNIVTPHGDNMRSPYKHVGNEYFNELQKAWTRTV